MNLIHRFLEKRKIRHQYNSSGLGVIFIGGLNNDEFSVTILPNGSIIKVYRTSSPTGDLDLTKEFSLDLSDPDLFGKIRKILCP